MDNKVSCSVINNIFESFINRESSSFYQSKYARQVLITNVISLELSNIDMREPGANITFSSNDFVEILPHDNDPIITNVKHENWDIKRVFIDPKSSTNMLI